MAEVWFNSIISVVLVSAVSLVGVITLFRDGRFLNKTLFFLISFSAGALLGDAFLHILPELSESGGLELSTVGYILGAILLFFILERVIRWHHHHAEEQETHTHPVAALNLLGDAVHNFLDGTIIAAAYLIDFRLGLATTIAVILHEIPQEVGDFAVLLHAGMSRARALLFNLLSAVAAVFGAIATILLTDLVPDLQKTLLALGAGGFIYIATTDLLPELHKEIGIKKSLGQLLGIILGIAIMYALLFLE